ncbi:MAG: FAD-binding oxidoreductase [Rhodobacteraceae bacterium]|nr:FAD-binding oxidoreductase [Paracoccaceae bacterium]
MQVARLPRDPGPAGWEQLLERPPPAKPLTSNIEADWIVIGAGFAGIGAVRRLSELDPTGRIVWLEAARVGSGPAGRNSGLMIDLPHDLTSEDYGGDLDHDRAQVAANRHAIEMARRLAEDAGLSKEAFDQCGKINAAAGAKGHQHNLDYANHLKALGEAHSFLDTADMREVTGIDYYQSGLFTPGTVMIQPAAFVRGVAARLVSNRVTLYEESPVTGLHECGDGWRAVTPKGEVRAPKVILAVNGHLESFGFKARQLMHVFTYASMTRALSEKEQTALGGRAHWGLTPADPMGTTVRRVGDRLVVRNRFTYEPDMEVSDAALARIVKTHDRSFVARFPMLSGVEMEYRWGGRLCLTRNGVGVTEEVAPGLWAACVQNGLGTVRGILSGLVAAEAAAGQVSPIARQVLAEAAPRKLPPKPIATLGARAVLRWNEFRAGREL